MQSCSAREFKPVKVYMLFFRYVSCFIMNPTVGVSVQEIKLKEHV